LNLSFRYDKILAFKSNGEAKMKERSYTRLKAACYTTSAAMSVVTNLAPILFICFRDLYGFSYTELALLVLINFMTQLLVDLGCSAFSHRMNTELLIKLTPFMTFIGLIIFALAPTLMPSSPYPMLLIGTMIYAASNGFAEVLISPIIAAIPAKDPEREVSKLHSAYAWGVAVIVPLCSLYILFVGGEHWQILALLSSLVPLSGFLLYLGTHLPPIVKPERASGAVSEMKKPIMWLCVTAIFLAGATECTMSAWASGYIEGALGIDKIYGDIFGLAIFAVMLGLGRTLYGKFGKSPEKILVTGAALSIVTYLVAALSPIPIISLIACALTGLTASMLWPGTIIVGADRLPSSGVLVYALMAAGGDFGAAVGPQLVGTIADLFKANTDLAATLGLAPDALGMRAGMLIGAIFPILATVAFSFVYKTKSKKKDN
jgi:fucose permease